MRIFVVGMRSSVHKIGIFIFLVLGLTLVSEAQSKRNYSQRGRGWWKTNNELGPIIGATFMMTDLGGGVDIGRNFLLDFDFAGIRPALGVNFRNNYNERLAFRTTLIYNMLGGSDFYSNADETGQDGYFRKMRQFNLRTHLVELVGTAEFNFRPFVPGDFNNRWTPYLGLGIGVAYYQPQTNITGSWENLRQRHTEGQMVKGNLEGKLDDLPDQPVGYYPLRKQYSLFTLLAPVNIGIKWNVNRNYILTFEAAYRFTNTDYLDDVSRTYVLPEDVLVTVGISANDELAQQEYLQYINPGAFLTNDEGVPFKPTYEVGEQRGDPSDKDGYGYIAMMSITYILQKQSASYNCPGRYSF